MRGSREPWTGDNGIRKLNKMLSNKHTALSTSSSVVVFLSAYCLVLNTMVVIDA